MATPQLPKYLKFKGSKENAQSYQLKTAALLLLVKMVVEYISAFQTSKEIAKQIAAPKKRRKQVKAKNPNAVKF